ncbi:hypothetical protein ABIE80_003709 [Bradyrhizobium diazoefficiens]
MKTSSSCWAATPCPLLLGAQVELLLARVAVDAVRHQRVRGIERTLDLGAAVALLALHDVVLGEIEIVQNAVGVGPLLEQIVVLEEVIVAEGGVRDHQRLHRRRILLHQIGDAGRGVDHDLIGEAHQALAVGGLVVGEVLAEGPVLVEQGHADRRVGIQHLLGGDDLDLVRIDVEPEIVLRHLLTGIGDALQGVEVPIRAFEQSFRHGAAFS